MIHPWTLDAMCALGFAEGISHCCKVSCVLDIFNGILVVVLSHPFFSRKVELFPLPLLDRFSRTILCDGQMFA